MAAKNRRDYAVHDMSSKPVKRIPLAELPANLRDRYRDRKGIFLYEDLTTSEMDEVVMELIQRPLLLLESELMTTKWFDYRILHPWQATALFLEAYRSEHAWIMRKREDVNSHWFHKGIKATSLCKTTPTQMTALWKARQAADSIGVPYDFYCNVLIDWAEKRNWTHLPRVNQLYLPDHVAVVKETWEDRMRTKLFVATEPYYRHDAGDSSHQIAYREFLRGQIARRSSREYGLASLIFQHEHLSEDQACQFFGEDVTNAAVRAARDLFGEKFEQSPQ